MSGSEGLYGSDFQTYFRRFNLIEPLFLGVTSIDKIPQTIPLKKFVIVNMSPSGTPGSHWIVIVRSHKKCLEIFNSLGWENLDMIRAHLKFRFAAEIEFNNTQVQMSTTATCGLFCIYFIIHRVLNFDLSLNETMSEIFTSNLSKNENKVTKFCSHLMETNNDESLIFDF